MNKETKEKRQRKKAQATQINRNTHVYTHKNPIKIQNQKPLYIYITIYNYSHYSQMTDEKTKALTQHYILRGRTSKDAAVFLFCLPSTSKYGIYP